MHPAASTPHRRGGCKRSEEFAGSPDAILVVVAAGDEWMGGKLTSQPKPVLPVPVDETVVLFPHRRAAVRPLVAAISDDRPVDEE